MLFPVVVYYLKNTLIEAVEPITYMDSVQTPVPNMLQDTLRIPLLVYQYRA
jgi:hypothetical protein